MRTSIAWGVFVSLTTELLGAFNVIGRPAIIAVWLTAVAVLLMMHRFTGTYLPTQWPRLPKSPLIGIAVLMCAVLLLIAWCAPPNTWDALSYHMPRVMHWIQAGNLDHYPTGNLRQLWNAPWSEYAFLHFHVLAGSDRFANLVQWFAMAGSLIVAGSIANRLTGSAAARDLAVILVVTLPTGLLQATGPQNNYIVAFWLLCAMHLILNFGRSERPRRRDVLSFAAAAALAVATKPIAWFWIAGLSIWCLAAVGRRSWRAAGALVAYCTLVTIALNGPLWLRNYRLFGSPLSPTEYNVHNSKLTNDEMSPRLFASNLVRNLSLHFGTLIPGANERVEGVVAELHRRLQVDPNDRRITTNIFQIPSGRANEDVAGSPLHVLLALIGFAAVLARRSLRRNAPFMALTFVCVLGAILFLLLLRWQPWGTRIQLPGLVLTMVATAVAIGGGSLSVSKSRRFLRRGVAAMISASVVIASLPALLLSTQRPLLPWSRSVLFLPRETQLSWHSGATKPMNDLIQRLRQSGSDRIALMLGPDDPEYLLWVGLAPTGRGAALFHINVENQSRVCNASDLVPDAVFFGPFFLGKGAQRAYSARGWSIEYGGRFAVAFPPREASAHETAGEAP